MPILTYFLSTILFYLRSYLKKWHKTSSQTYNYTGMKVIVVPCLIDNYSYLIVDLATQQTAVVDPVDVDAVLEVCNSENLKLTTVLTTHHHLDHSGGNYEIASKMKDIKVVGFSGEKRIPSMNTPLSHGQTIQIGSTKITLLHTPCHTTGHAVYYVENNQQKSPLLFTGDTLFIGGCGKFFEGDASHMHKALTQVIGSLPSNTLIFCGHEYTVKNLMSASTLEPDNTAINRKLEWAQQQRQLLLPTVPSTVMEEKSYNPFFRTSYITVAKSLGLSDTEARDPVRVLAAVRTQKDNWSPPSKGLLQSIIDFFSALLLKQKKTN